MGAAPPDAPVKINCCLLLLAAAYGGCHAASMVDVSAAHAAYDAYLPCFEKLVGTFRSAPLFTFFSLKVERKGRIQHKQHELRFYPAWIRHEAAWFRHKRHPFCHG